MATQHSNVGNPLKSKLLSPHGRLQEAARKGSKKYVKQGQQGPHVVGVQKALNSLRTKKVVWYFNPSGIKVRPSWGLVPVNGEFDNKTYAALKAFQDWANRWNRWSVDLEVRIITDSTPGTQKYKNLYYTLRRRVKRDGIAGPVTLDRLDWALWVQNANI